MKSRLVLLYIFTILFVGLVSAQETNKVENKNTKSVELAGTRILNIHSGITNREYDLYINLPRYYDKDTTKAFPVLFVLDAQWDFPLVYTIYGELYYDGMVPGIITVGITWGGKDPDYDSLRAADLSPTHNDQILQSGEGPKFLKFIKDELTPFIESKYRVDKYNRALMGSSFGGLFTLYTLFTETELFNKYILTSPALQWDNSAIYNIEKKYAGTNSALPVKLYMTTGEYEDVQGFNRFVNMLKERNYEGLQMETSILFNTGHSGTKAEGYSRGMRFAYKKTSITLDEEILKQYTGTYEVSSATQVELTIENNQLTVVYPNNKVKLFAESETDFFEQGVYNFFHFEKDESGKIKGYLLEQYDGNSFITKID